MGATEKKVYQKQAQLMKPCQIKDQQVSWTSLGFKPPTFHSFNFSNCNSNIFNTADLVCIHAAYITHNEVPRFEPCCVSEPAADYSISLECP